VLRPSYTGQFKKDLRRVEKSGNKNIEKLKTVIRLLIAEDPLPARCGDHPLSGNFKGRRECHIAPDWLLVYKPLRQSNEIVFERTGSHADLFE